MAKKDINGILTGDGRIQTVLGLETNFNGEMEFKEPLQINGHFTGKLKTKGFLFVAESAKITADITAGSVVIAGEVHGNIVALNRIEMLPSAKLFGDIRSAKLKIAR